jgi:hypothetical protein
MMHVRVHAAGVRVHAACAYPCCMFIFVLFTLEVYVRAACPGPSCIPKSVYWMFMSMMHVNVHTAVHVHASCPCPCCMSMSMLHVHVFSCPWCMPMLLVHNACTCCMFMLQDRYMFYAAYPCLSMMHEHAACLWLHAACPWITFLLVCKTHKLIRISHFFVFARHGGFARIALIFSRKEISLGIRFSQKKLWNETHRQRWPPNQSSPLLSTAGTLKFVNFLHVQKSVFSVYSNRSQMKHFWVKTLIIGHDGFKKLQI